MLKFAQTIYLTQH